MSKYNLLEKYLREQPEDEVPLTFDEIERVIGAKLPPSQRYAAWWSNNPSNNVMTRAWLNAGFHSEQVDLKGRKLVFRRVSARSQQTRPENREIGMSEGPANFHSNPDSKTNKHPLLGALKMTIVFEAGFDLTQPAMPEWSQLLNVKCGAEPQK